MNGRTTPVAPLGNNHGGIEKINGQYYTFHHRQTNGTEFSRQGCAEPIEIAADGSIKQVEITSCGLNGGPLKGAGTYPAPICCHVTDPTTLDHINYDDPALKTQIRIVEHSNVPYVTDVKDGAKLGYKYFDFDYDTPTAVALEVRGTFDGTVTAATDEELSAQAGVGRVSINSPEHWTTIAFDLTVEGTQALYFGFAGNGNLDVKSFTFIK